MTYLVDTKEGFTKPVVKEFGRDGNAFALMAQVSQALKRAGHADVAQEFQTRGMASHSYDEVLQLCDQYGNLEPYASEVEEDYDDDGEDEFEPFEDFEDE